MKNGEVLMKTSDVILAVAVGVVAAVIATVVIQKANLNPQQTAMVNLLKEQNMLLQQKYQQRYLW